MKSSYDIAFLCQYFYPEYVSSATLPYDTAEHFASEGLRVKAVCGFPGEYLRGETVRKQEKYNGVDIVRLPYLKLSRVSTFGRVLNFVSFFTSALVRVRQLRNCKCVIVYSNPPMLPLIALLAKKLYRAKIIFVCYDIYPELALLSNSASPDGLLTRVMKWVNRHFYPQTDLIITLSEDMKQYLLENRDIKADVKVIPNWFEDENISGNQVYQTDDNNRSDCVVASYFGNMGVVQDVETILDAAELLRNSPGYSFRFAGHGVKRSVIENAITMRRSKNVLLDGFLHDEAYYRALVESSCCIVTLIPGVSDLCSPSKVYAYMMMGKPIIAIMDSCELSDEIVREQAGVHFHNGDAQGLMHFLVKAKSKPDEVRTMGQKSRQLFERKYSKTICLRQYTRAVSPLL